MSQMPAFSQRHAGQGAIVNPEDLDPGLLSRSHDDDDKNFSTEKGDGTAHILTEQQVKEIVVVNDGT